MNRCVNVSTYEHMWKCDNVNMYEHVWQRECIWTHVNMCKNTCKNGNVWSCSWLLYFTTNSSFQSDDYCDNKVIFWYQNITKQVQEYLLASVVYSEEEYLPGERRRSKGKGFCSYKIHRSSPAAPHSLEPHSPGAVNTNRRSSSLMVGQQRAPNSYIHSESAS